MLALRSLGLCLCLLVGACVTAPAPSLYERLGSEVGVQRIADGFLYELGGDRRVLPLFADTNIERFREKFAEQLCDIAEGPCVYSGDSMRETHRNLGITHAQFNRVVTHLVVAMEREGVPTAAQNDLLRRLAALYGEVVGL